jgi:NTP pyrophosphatase (non-canonical NTP hydrolase)
MFDKAMQQALAEDGEKLRQLTGEDHGPYFPDAFVDTANYQEFVRESAIFPKRLGIIYCALKLAGEAGEVSEKIGKAIRDNGAYDEVTGELVLAPEKRLDLLKELGDVTWYITALAAELGSTLEEVIETNVEKLQSRRARGVIQGSGDNR